MSLETMRAMIGRAELVAGFWSGIVALAVGLGLAFARRGGWDGTPLAVAGLLFAAAFATALALTLGLPGGLGFGLISLAGAAMLGQMRAGPAIVPVLAIPGAWMVMWRSENLPEDLMRLLLGVAVVTGGWLLADFDARQRRQGLGVALFAVSVIGVYFTVPDTETALVALGAALPLTLLGWPWPLASLGGAGAYAAAGSLLWVVATGGVGRGSSIIGGIACLGLLAAEPLARLLHPGRRSVLDLLPDGRLGAVVAGVLHLGLVYVAARVAGTRATLAEATTVALAEFGMAVALMLLATIAWSRLAT
jgi:hypothetical protein